MKRGREGAPLISAVVELNWENNDNNKRKTTKESTDLWLL